MHQRRPTTDIAQQVATAVVGGLRNSIVSHRCATGNRCATGFVFDVCVYMFRIDLLIQNRHALAQLCLVVPVLCLHMLLPGRPRWECAYRCWKEAAPAKRE